MSKFTTKLVVSPLPNGKDWSVESGFEYHVGEYPSEEIIIVPTGFITDFASIPRFVWPIICPFGKHGKAAVIHDYCYRTLLYDKRKKADDIFLEGMIVLNVNPIKRSLIYFFVRVFGIFPWIKHKYFRTNK